MKLAQEFPKFKIYLIKSKGIWLKVIIYNTQSWLNIDFQIQSPSGSLSQLYKIFELVAIFMNININV
jgi:hypothetical protein